MSQQRVRRLPPSLKIRAGSWGPTEQERTDCRKLSSGLCVGAHMSKRKEPRDRPGEVSKTCKGSRGEPGWLRLHPRALSPGEDLAVGVTGTMAESWATPGSLMWDPGAGRHQTRDRGGRRASAGGRRWRGTAGPGGGAGRAAVPGGRGGVWDAGPGPPRPRSAHRRRARAPARTHRRPGPPAPGPHSMAPGRPPVRPSVRPSGPRPGLLRRHHRRSAAGGSEPRSNAAPEVIRGECASEEVPSVGGAGQSDSEADWLDGCGRCVCWRRGHRGWRSRM